MQRLNSLNSRNRPPFVFGFKCQTPDMQLEAVMNFCSSAPVYHVDFMALSLHGVYDAVMAYACD